MRPQRSLLLIACTIGLTLFAMSRPAAAAVFDGNTWTTTGKLTFQVKKIGKNKADVNATVIFTNTTFEILGGDGTSLLVGGYVSNGKGKAELVPLMSSLETFMTNGIQEVLDDAGYNGKVERVSLGKTKGSAKCKGNSKGLQLSTKLSVKAETSLAISGPEAMDLDTSVSFSVSLKGTIPPDASASGWFGNGKTKTKITGGGNQKGGGQVELTFGPLGNVPAGQYSLFIIEEGIDVVGMFSQSEATVTLEGLGEGLAPLLEQNLEEDLGVDVTVQLVSDDSTFSYKPGKSGKLSSKIAYSVVVGSTEESFPTSVTLSGKLSATPD